MCENTEDTKNTEQGQSRCSDLLESDPRVSELLKGSIALNRRLDELILLIQQHLEKSAESFSEIKKTVGQLLPSTPSVEKEAD